MYIITDLKKSRYALDDLPAYIQGCAGSTKISRRVFQDFELKYIELSFIIKNIVIIDHE